MMLCRHPAVQQPSPYTLLFFMSIPIEKEAAESVQHADLTNQRFQPAAGFPLSSKPDLLTGSWPIPVNPHTHQTHFKI